MIAGRITLGRVARAFGAMLAITMALAAITGTARTQNTQVMMPDQSTQKARQLLQQTIQALGGPAYLGLQDTSCEGRLSTFGHSGDLTGFDTYFDFSKFPDKDRTEHSKKRSIIEVFNGNKGWVLDKGGVADAPESAMKEWTETLKTDIDHLLRYRINEPGMIVRYGGPDVVELKEVGWVELEDSDGRTIRLALDSNTHFPVQEVVISRDPGTQLRVEQIYYFSNYHPISGVQTPFQVGSTRNDIKVFQAFTDKCTYNNGLTDSLFTRESLEERWGQLDKKKKKK